MRIMWRPSFLDLDSYTGNYIFSGHLSRIDREIERRERERNACRYKILDLYQKLPAGFKIAAYISIDTKQFYSCLNEVSYAHILLKDVITGNWDARSDSSDDLQEFVKIIGQITFKHDKLVIHAIEAGNQYVDKRGNLCEITNGMNTYYKDKANSYFKKLAMLIRENPVIDFNNAVIFEQNSIREYFIDIQQYFAKNQWRMSDYEQPINESSSIKKE